MCSILMNLSRKIMALILFQLKSFMQGRRRILGIFVSMSPSSIVTQTNSYLCKFSVKNKLCTKTDCTFIHLKGTRRNESDSAVGRKKGNADNKKSDPP
jgi:hypothetical protein